MLDLAVLSRCSNTTSMASAIEVLPASFGLSVTVTPVGNGSMVQRRMPRKLRSVIRVILMAT
jgi:hypothetical protein